MLLSLNLNPPDGNMTKLFFLLTIFVAGGCSNSSQYQYVKTTTATSHGALTAKDIRIKPSYPRYIIKKGDTLSSISRRSKLSVNNIIRFNQLKSSHLEVGQQIYLPGVYKLKPDHSLKYATAPIIFKRPTPQSKIIARKHWAKDKIKSNTIAMGNVNKITVHHTDDAPNLKKMTDIQFLRAIENHHRNNRKWACIGYHFIIGRNGTIYEGRPAKYQGAHASKNNPHNLGIALIGDFNKAAPAKSQLAALNALLSQLRIKHKITASKVYGHGHLGQTHCPGKHLKRWLEVYRARR